MAIDNVVDTQIPLELPIPLPESPKPVSKDNKVRVYQPPGDGYADGDLVPDANEVGNPGVFSMYE